MGLSVAQSNGQWIKTTNKKTSHPNITKEEREAIKTLKEDDTWVVLTADKGVVIVVMDKSSYVDKCMTLLQDTNVYKPRKDLTSQIHRHVQTAFHKLKGKHGKEHQMSAITLQPIAPHR